MATRSETQLLNETFFEQLETPGMEKQAVDAVNEFTRIKMREDGFFRRILPMVSVSNEDLTRQVDTDLPVIVVDKEVDNPPAMTIPFRNLPINQYIYGSRYLVQFARLVTPKFTKDIDELRTYVMDIRQVLSDNAIKDMLAEEDGTWIETVDTALVGADTVVPVSGVPQWVTIAGGITRDTLQDAFKVLPKTPWHLEAHTVLINNVTIREIFKWGRDEMGGDFAQDVVKNGWTEQEFMNARWIVTIKRDLVDDDTIYMFADPKFMGKSYELEATSMFIKREAWNLEFFAWETIGHTLAHAGSVSRVDFV